MLLIRYSQVLNHTADCKVCIRSIAGLPESCQCISVSYHLPSDAAAAAAAAQLDDQFGFCCDPSHGQGMLAESRYSSPWYDVTEKCQAVAMEWTTSTFMTLSPEIENFFVSEAMCVQVVLSFSFLSFKAVHLVEC